MLDREAVCCFLQIQFEKWGIEPPTDISMDMLLETFCRFVEEDYYEWLKDNFKTFFNHGNPDWEWIKGRIKEYTSSSQA